MDDDSGDSVFLRNFRRDRLFCRFIPKKERCRFRGVFLLEGKDCCEELTGELRKMGLILCNGRSRLRMTVWRPRSFLGGIETAVVPEANQEKGDAGGYCMFCPGSLATGNRVFLYLP